MASLSERNIGGPDRNRGVLTTRRGRALEVHDGSKVDRNNGHIVVKLIGEEAKGYMMSEPVILYKRDGSG